MKDKGFQDLESAGAQFELEWNVAKEHADYIRTFGYETWMIMSNAWDWFITWENIMSLPYFISRFIFMISGIFGMNLKSYLEEHVVCWFPKSYSMHDLLDSSCKLLPLSFIEITKFFGFLCSLHFGWQQLG